MYKYAGCTYMAILSSLNYLIDHNGQDVTPNQNNHFLLLKIKLYLIKAMNKAYLIQQTSSIIIG